jgi:hypothetical protein
MAQSSQSDPVGTATKEHAPDSPPASWNEALAILITTRAAILQTESKIAARHVVSSILKWIIAGLFMLFAWMLMIIAIMSVLVSSMDWKWHWVITGAGLFHLLVAAVLLATVKPDKHGYFPITRSEFLKDSEWLKNFQKQKSND